MAEELFSIKKCDFFRRRIREIKSCVVYRFACSSKIL